MSQVISIWNFFTFNMSKNKRFNTEKYLKQFSSLKNNLDRVNFVYKDLQEKCPNFPPFVEDVKNDEEAVRKRQEGNIFFKLGNYRQALDCYTASILMAKSDSVLGMAYANRSAALFRLNFHEECLVDIERALKHGYPDKFKPKLTKRQKDCNVDNYPRRKFHEPTPVIADSEKNVLIQCARNCVKIARKEQYGRCVIATRDIEIGEILAVEEPFAAVIEDQIYVHCHECFELCYNLIPCKHCTKALYCSENCKDKAFEMYHKYECPILLSLDCIQLDYPKRLALKMVFMAEKELQQSNNYTFEENEMYYSNRFKEVFNMDTHVEKRQPENIMARALAAAAFFHLIKTRSTFLYNGVNENRVKEFLLTLILVCSVNTVGTNEMSPQSPIHYDLNPFATTIYSFYNIFNHSCWANVIRQYHGSTMVMRAHHTIKKGEQCFVLYGPNYMEFPKWFRQNFLSENQFFTCTCRACEENWSPSVPIPRVPIWWDLNYDLINAKLLMGDVDFAKEVLETLLAKAKEAEKSWPLGSDCLIKETLWICYNNFGNIRRQ